MDNEKVENAIGWLVCDEDGNRIELFYDRELAMGAANKNGYYICLMDDRCENATIVYDPIWTPKDYKYKYIGDKYLNKISDRYLNKINDALENYIPWANSFETVYMIYDTTYNRVRVSINKDWAIAYALLNNYIVFIGEMTEDGEIPDEKGDLELQYDQYCDILDEMRQEEMKRNGYDNPDDHRTSTCPICGDHITKSDSFETLADNVISYPWNCPNCGTRGQELYTLEFLRHSYIELCDEKEEDKGKNDVKEETK